MEKRGEETGTTGTMMGSSAIIGRSKEEGLGEIIIIVADNYLLSRQSTALSYYSASPCKLRCKTLDIFTNKRHFVNTLRG